MYVSGQWDVSVLKGMEGQKFFCITAGGDAKASGGQHDVMAMFGADDILYSYGTWRAQDSEEEQSAAGQLISLGLDANMVRFEAGTVFKEGESGTERMASFNYGYRLVAVRDWLFEQTK
jgi:predicted peptidase